MKIRAKLYVTSFSIKVIVGTSKNFIELTRCITPNNLNVLQAVEISAYLRPMTKKEIELVFYICKRAHNILDMMNKFDSIENIQNEIKLHHSYMIN